MFKIILLSLLLIVSVSIYSRTIEVCQSGTKDFVRIQHAINHAVSGDTVLVHPGVYRENLNIIAKSITLASLYSINSDSLYIKNTNIVGNVGSHVVTIFGRVDNNQPIDTRNKVIIDGFTITNNWYLDTILPTLPTGTGIRIHEISATIKNNIIKNNLGVGVLIRGGFIWPFYFEIDVHLENNQIFNNVNKDGHGGGGLFIYFPSNVTFCHINRNSIYNNHAKRGHDIFIFSHFAPPTDILIYLDKGSRKITNFDYFFVDYLNSHMEDFPAIFSIDILRESQPAMAFNDVFVAPWGDDSNNGLSINSPLKTIDRATRIIAHDTKNPLTINLLPGVYSLSLNNQRFPFKLPGNIKLIGAGKDATIIDGEEFEILFCSTHPEAHNELSDMKITNFGFNQPLRSTVKIYGGTIKFSNLLFYNNRNENNAFLLVGVRNTSIENVEILNSIGRAIETFNSENVTINGLTINGLSNSIGYGSIIWMIGLNNIHVNNLTMINLIAMNLPILGISWSGDNKPIETGTMVFNNILVANNEIINHWDLSSGSVVAISNIYSDIEINNVTIAHNRVDRYEPLIGLSGIIFGGLSVIGRNATVNNSIFYHPDILGMCELGVHADNETRVFNSLIYTVRPSRWTGDDPLPWLLSISKDIIVNTSPQFVGMFDANLTPDMIEYYHLHKSSPAVNAGLADISHLNLPPFDLAGNQRVWDGRIDMGAFEFNSEPWVTERDVTIPEIVRFNLVNFPNPFNPSTTIQFTIGNVDNVRLNVYNVRGQLVKTLINDVKEAGNHAVVWNGDDHSGNSVSSGIYFYRMETSAGSEVRRMVLMK